MSQATLNLNGLTIDLPISGLVDCNADGDIKGNVFPKLNLGTRKRVDASNSRRLRSSRHDASGSSDSRLALSMPLVVDRAQCNDHEVAQPAIDRASSLVVSDLAVSASIGLTTAAAAFAMGSISVTSAAMFALGSFSAHFIVAAIVMCQKNN